MDENLRRIAEGGDFDVVEAIRALAQAQISAVAAGKSEPVANAEDIGALVNARLAKLLMASGFKTVAAVTGAKDEDLLAIEGVDEKALKLIRDKIR